MVSKPCPVCKGNRVTRGEAVLEVWIEQGVPEGHQITHEMEADQNPDQIPGDVIFVLNTSPHALFTRKGDDLEAKMTISLKQALIGFQATITHMDGHEVIVKNDGVTQYGQRFKIAGEGMPKHQVPSEKGDLHVTVNVNLPKRLSEEQKKAFAEIFGYQPPAAAADTEE